MHRDYATDRASSMLGFGMARILIADDDSRLRALLRCVFAAEDYDVAEAVDGDEAVTQVAAHRPAGVIPSWSSSLLELPCPVLAPESVAGLGTLPA